MARRKLKSKNTRKLVKLGKTSLAVTLPIEMTKSLKWRERQKVVVKKVRGGVLVKDWPVSPKARRGGKK